jgi:hypothetical protein
VEAHNGGKWPSDSQAVTLNMLGIDGIEINAWPSLLVNYFIEIIFQNSLIEFYLNGALLSGNKTCSKEYFNEKAAGNVTFFKVFQTVIFALANSYPSGEPSCPYMFENATMQTFEIWGQIDTILIRNIFQFIPFNNYSKVTAINADIQEVALCGYGYNLDTNILHPLVFKTTNWILIFKSVGSIQTNLFQNLSQLDTIYFNLDNLKDFIHRIGIEWTTKIVTYPTAWVIFVDNYVWVNEVGYTYPDSDFCLFAQYNQQKNLIYVLGSPGLSKCTSTIRWLLWNYVRMNMSSTYNAYPDSKQIYSICANSSNGPFDFEPFLAKCNLTHGTREAILNAEYYQDRFIIEFVQNLVIFIAIPLACLLGLFLNILIIRAVHKNKEKELKDEFYSYMSLNAVFNCFYCVIFVFYPINSCTDSLSEYFCSSIRQSNVTQYYKIVFIAYFGETFKMCANISYVLMNVNRYMLIGREHKPLFVKISKLNFKLVVVFTFAFSALINVGHGFEYQLNKGLSYNWDSDSLYLNLNAIYPSDFAIDESLYLYIYVLVYFLINFLLFFILNTWVEVTIVRKLHSELASKKKRLDGMGAKRFSRANIGDVTTSFRKRRKQEIEDGAERRAILMVVINALINLFFRLPEIVVILAQSESLTESNFLYVFFFTFTSLPDFVFGIAYFTYILTFSTNFLIYYIFNLKFKQTFSEWNYAKKRL